MRVAVISDIHANLVALEAVLASADAEGVDAVWCLGDTVGYGPRPNECCALVRKRADVCLVGNHDLVALGRISAEEFNHDARDAALWTRDELDAGSRAFLEALEPHAAEGEVELFHASARDPVWEYVLGPDAARGSLEATTAPLVLVGHSHVALAFSRAGARVTGGVAPDGTRLELGAGRLLVNPGSVGQPRDGDPRAAWLLLDTAARFGTFHRVHYSVERTQSEIRERGLPGSLAARLAWGQ